MKKKGPFSSQEKISEVHHRLVEQIAKMSVAEEEERMKAELELNRQLKND